MSTTRLDPVEVPPVVTIFPHSPLHGSGREAARPFFARRLGVAFREVWYVEEDQGKPSIEGRPEVHIGLSHSHRLLAAYIGPENIGIDIELIRPRRTMDDFVREVFLPEEIRWYAQGGVDQLLRFYQVWTRKEAILKYYGRSIWEITRPVHAEAGPHAVHYVVERDSPGAGEPTRHALCLYSRGPVRPEFVHLDADLHVYPSKSVPPATTGAS